MKKSVSVLLTVLLTVATAFLPAGMCSGAETSYNTYSDGIRISENEFEKETIAEPFKVYYSTRLNKQVFVYRKAYVDINDLNVLNRTITKENIILYVNESIANDEYLNELKNIQVKAIPRNILKGDFYE